MAQDYTSIRVTEAAKADAQQSKREEETWNDYLRRCAENPPETIEHVRAEDVADITATVRPTLDEDALDEIIEQIQAEIDTLAFDGAVAHSEADRIIERLDALEARLLEAEGVGDD